MKKTGAVLAVGFYLLAGSALAQRTDQVVPKSGAPSSGTVLSMTKTEVVVDVRGRQQRVAVNDIKRVIFADDPPELRRARENVLTGNYEAAAGDLKKLKAADISRDFVKQDFLFYSAFAQSRLALSGGGDKTAAETAMYNFVRGAPNNYHFFDAAQTLGDLAVALEDYSKAAVYYGALGKSPWSEYQLRGSVLEGRSLLAQGKTAEALAKFETVIGSSVDTPDALRQKQLANVAKAVCLASSGDHDQGISLLENVIADHDPESNPELFGRAYNALGECYLKADRKKDALLAYLHVDLLFYRNPDVHAEALYHLSKLWSEVNKSDRAVSARNLLTTRYSGSAWAKKP